MDADILDMARHWYGYGRWEAKYWFIGPEPGQPEGDNVEGDNVRARCKAWIELGRGELEARIVQGEAGDGRVAARVGRQPAHVRLDVDEAVAVGVDADRRAQVGVLGQRGLQRPANVDDVGVVPMVVAPRVHVGGDRSRWRGRAWPLLFPPQEADCVRPVSAHPARGR